MEKKSTRAIVADVNEDNGVMISKILESLGYNVKIAHNIDVFNDALNDSPNLIVIDEPTTEFIELLRKTPRSKIPKLIIISKDRYSKNEKEILAEKLNAVDFFQFPFDLDEFENKISCYL